jgi:hypothetical protein
MTSTPEPTITPQPSPTPYVSNLSDLWATPTARPTVVDERTEMIRDVFQSFDMEETIYDLTDGMVGHYNSTRQVMDVVVMFFVAVMLVIMLSDIMKRIREL